jgi:hypothetical protein
MIGPPSVTRPTGRPRHAGVRTFRDAAFGSYESRGRAALTDQCDMTRRQITMLRLLEETVRYGVEASQHAAEPRSHGFLHIRPGVQ